MSDFVKNPMFESKTKFTISNVPIFYAKIFEDHYDDYEGKLRYKLTMQLDPALAGRMESSGFNIKFSDEGGAYLDAFRNHKTKDGKVLPPPKVVFEDGSTYDKEVHGFIGNGTVCDLEVSAQYYTMKQKQGKQMVDVTYLPCYLDKVIIKEFVPYESESAGNAADIF